MPDRLAQTMRRYRLSDDRPTAETSIERLMRAAFDQLGVVYTDQGHVGRYRPDFIVTVDSRRAVVECDGPVHRRPSQQVKDRRKDAAYTAAGLPVFRFTDQEIRRSPIGCAQRVLQQLRGSHAFPSAEPAPTGASRPPDDPPAHAGS